MTVYVVLVNGKVDTVFADHDSAQAYAKQRLLNWNLVDVQPHVLVND